MGVLNFLRGILSKKSEVPTADVGFHSYIEPQSNEVIESKEPKYITKGEFLDFIHAHSAPAKKPKKQHQMPRKVADDKLLEYAIFEVFNELGTPLNQGILLIRIREKLKKLKYRGYTSDHYLRPYLLQMHNDGKLNLNVGKAGALIYSLKLPNPSPKMPKGDKVKDMADKVDYSTRRRWYREAMSGMTAFEIARKDEVPAAVVDFVLYQIWSREGTSGEGVYQ